VYTEAFQTLISDAAKALLAMDNDKNIHALQSFKVAGSTLLCPTTKLMHLLGTGANATALSSLTNQAFQNLATGNTNNN
jgi:hypothetical protein